MLQVGNAGDDLSDLRSPLLRGEYRLRIRECLQVRADGKEHVVHVVPESCCERANRGQSIRRANLRLDRLDMSHITHIHREAKSTT